LTDITTLSVNCNCVMNTSADALSYSCNGGSTSDVSESFVRWRMFGKDVSTIDEWRQCAMCDRCRQWDSSSSWSTRWQSTGTSALCSTLHFSDVLSQLQLPLW